MTRRPLAAPGAAPGSPRPRSGRRLASPIPGMARLCLRLIGWRAVGSAPALDRYVVIAAPHTSNWDGALLLLFGFVFQMRVRWLVKNTIFWWPLGPLLLRLGAIPVERTRRTNAVQRLADQIRAADRFVLAVPPEGTRALREHWKSGFYHIAKAAGVPIVCSFLDFGRREGGIGPIVAATGDIAADMDVFRSFYADKLGRFPEKFGPIRLREETT